MAFGKSWLPRLSNFRTNFDWLICSSETSVEFLPFMSSSYKSTRDEPMSERPRAALVGLKEIEDRLKIV